jgi:hypothetical protein
MIKKVTRLKAQTASVKPETPKPITNQRGTWRRRMRSEIKKTPVAIACAALAAVLAAVPFAIGAIGNATDKDLTIQVLPVRWSAGQTTSPSAVVPRAIPSSDLPPLDNLKFHDWARKYDAVYANRLEVSFVARSDSTQQVAIRDARIVMVDRADPLSGVWIEPTGAGPGPERVLWADLETDPPTTRTDGGWEFPRLISSSELEAFTVIAQVENCYCRFRIELQYVDSAGDVKTTTIDNDGKPFAVTSTQNITGKIHAQ